MKKAIATFLTFVMIMTLAGCGKSSINKEPMPDTLRLVSGDEAGTYFAFGDAMAHHVSANTDLDVVCISGTGSKGNLEALRDKNAEFAFCQSDVMSYAREGKNTFDEPMEDFSVVGSLYSEQVQIVTLNKTIRTVFDLKGKRVSIGAAGSGVYFNALDILNAYDLVEADLEPSYHSFTESVDALRNGMIDAAFVVAGTPTAAIEDLIETEGEVYFVSFDKNHLARLLELSPYYSKFVIPKETYGTISDVNTVGVNAVLLARNEVPDEMVYSLCRDIFDNAASLAAEHEKFSDLNPESAAGITSVPYHPGALKYFEEKGVR